MDVYRIKYNLMSSMPCNIDVVDMHSLSNEMIGQLNGYIGIYINVVGDGTELEYYINVDNNRNYSLPLHGELMKDVREFMRNKTINNILDNG